MAYDQHSCAVHWDCIADDKRSIAVHSIASLMISIVVQCNRIK